jgi:predicted transcriptional regulator
MPSKETTSLKLPASLKRRVARVAQPTGRTPHAFMVDAIERQTTYEERLRDFIAEATLADRAIDGGQGVYEADAVHAWLDRLAVQRPGKRPAKRPRSCRG